MKPRRREKQNVIHARKHDEDIYLFVEAYFSFLSLNYLALYCTCTFAAGQCDQIVTPFKGDDI